MKKNLLIILISVLVTCSVFAKPEKVEKPEISEMVNEISIILGGKSSGIYMCNSFSDVSDLVNSNTETWTKITTLHVEDYQESNYPVYITIVEKKDGSTIGLVMMHQGYKVCWAIAPL